MVELTQEQIDKLKALGKTQWENLCQSAEDFKAQQKEFQACIYTCDATGCHSGGASGVIDAFRESLEHFNLTDKVRMVRTGCMGLCAAGPLARLEIKGQDPFLYQRVTPDLARLIVAEHLKPALENQTVHISAHLKEHELSLSLPFFKMQKRVVLEHLGHSDPENLAEYVALGGYSALHHVLTQMTPEEVIAEIKKSGLRGRGGAGFLTGQKWEFLAKQPADEGIKYVICNGDEGDPGAYMDSCILGGGAHNVLEGMMIAAYATGATEGWFYIRAEYPLALERVELAIKQAKKAGILGRYIFGTDFCFNAQLRYGAGAFVCGEETALIASLEGKRGNPHSRPPYPVQKGLFDKPSIVNNVETLANISKIINKGADWFASIGTEKSKGTKVFALTGKVNHSGLVEVPMGTTIGDMVEKIGGGTSTGKPFKAVQTGGPSGGVIPASQLNLQLCYDCLRAVGSMMGSGGMIVMDSDDSMVEIAKFYLSFTVDESCGKCAPCRLGGYQMLQLLKKIAAGQGTRKDIEKIKKIGSAMQKASLCALGQTAPNPVLSTMKFFPEEYEALLVEEKPDLTVKQCYVKSPVEKELINKPCQTCGGCQKGECKNG